MTNTIAWLGHATVRIELDGTRLITDPVLRPRVGPLVRVAPPVSPAHTAAPDAVLLSHLHADHADLPSLRGIAGEAPVIAPAGAGGWLERRGLRHVVELRAGGTTRIGASEIRAVPAVHSRRRRPLGGPEASPIGYLITGSASVYFAGDTDLFEAMAELKGKVDVALLPISGWGSRLGPGHLDPERAAEAAAAIEPRVAIPIHWGTLALRFRARGHADPAAPARRFAELTRARARAVEVRVLEPGEITRIG